MIRILLADDQPLIRSGIRALLEAEDDIEVVAEAADGRQAVALAVEHRPDIALVDIQMPVLDGYSAVRKIRQWEAANERGRTPIIALTASALEGDVRRASEVGCDMHVSKPVKKSTLLKAIADVVENCQRDDAAAKAGSSGGRASTSVQE